MYMRSSYLLPSMLPLRMTTTISINICAYTEREKRGKRIGEWEEKKRKRRKQMNCTSSVQYDINRWFLIQIDLILNLNAMERNLIPSKVNENLENFTLHEICIKRKITLSNDTCHTSSSSLHGIKSLANGEEKANKLTIILTVFILTSMSYTHTQVSLSSSMFIESTFSFFLSLLFSRISQPNYPWQLEVFSRPYIDSTGQITGNSSPSLRSMICILDSCAY